MRLSIGQAPRHGSGIAVGLALAAVLAAAVGCTDDKPARDNATGGNGDAVGSGPEASPPPVLRTDAVWRPLTPAPTRRTEVAAAVSGTRIVVVGGFAGDGATVPTTEILDTATGRWEAGPDLPLAVNHAMAATVDDTVHVFGGYRSDGKPSAAAYRLEPTGWRAVAPLPQPRAAGTAVAQGGVVYVAAGVGPDGLAAAMLVYDPAGDRWSTAPGPPTRREHLGGAGYGGLVYTVGGRRGGLDTNVAAFEVYDPKAGTWTVLPGLPTPRGGLAATAVCTGLIVAIGGEAAATFAEVEAFTISTGTWNALPRSPTPRHGLGVVALRNAVYTLAGGPRPGLHVADTVELLDLGAGCP